MTQAPESEQDLLRLAELAKLLAHPIRLRIVTAIPAGRAISASELTEQFGDVSLSTCAYHVRILVKGEVLKLVNNRQVRGATEHFYELSLSPFLELTGFMNFLETRSLGGNDGEGGERES